jgi:hypothetical protein
MFLPAVQKYRYRSDKMKEITTNENSNGQRFNKFITKSLQNSSKSMMHKMIQKTEVEK